MSEDGTIPIGLVRVATLDGLVDQMLTGEVDLSKAILVAARSSLNAVRSIVQDGVALIFVMCFFSQNPAHPQWSRRCVYSQVTDSTSCMPNIIASLSARGKT